MPEIGIESPSRNVDSKGNTITIFDHFHTIKQMRTLILLIRNECCKQIYGQHHQSIPSLAVFEIDALVLCVEKQQHSLI